MADPTTLSSANAVVATEILSTQVIQAHLPRLGVMMSLGHYDRSMDGARSLVREVGVNTDLGASSAGTEATDPSPSPTVELAHGSPEQATISTGVLEIALLSEEVVTTELGMTDAQAKRMFDLMGIGAFTVDNFLQLLRPYVERLIPMGLQKIEADGLALFSGFSGSVGNATNYVSPETMLEAVFAHRRDQPLRPPQEGRFALGNSQLERLSKIAYTSQGGIGGSLWNAQADFTLARVPPGSFQGNGFIGVFMGRPVHEVDEELVPTSGGADVGAYGTFGLQGISATAPVVAGRPGAIEFAEKTPLQIRVDVDVSRRVIELTMLARYVWHEINDGDARRVLGKS